MFVSPTNNRKSTPSYSNLLKLTSSRTSYLLPRPTHPLQAPSTTISKMSVRVIARIRPLLKSELEKDTIITSHGSVVKIPNPKNAGEEFSFQFNSVYGPEAGQQEVFEGESKLHSYFNGKY